MTVKVPVASLGSEILYSLPSSEKVNASSGTLIGWLVSEEFVVFSTG